MPSKPRPTFSPQYKLTNQRTQRTKVDRHIGKGCGDGSVAKRIYFSGRVWLAALILDGSQLPGMIDPGESNALFWSSRKPVLSAQSHTQAHDIIKER